MSSETSTKQVRLKADAAADPGLQPWQFFVLAALGCATAVTFIARGRGPAAIILLSVLMAVLLAPRLLDGWLSGRRRERGYRALSRGMIAIGAGDVRKAKRHATDAAKLIEGEPLTLLLAAQTAQAAGDAPGARAAFEAMLPQPDIGDDAEQQIEAVESEKVAENGELEKGERAGKRLLQHPAADLMNLRS